MPRMLKIILSWALICGLILGLTACTAAQPSEKGAAEKMTAEKLSDLILTFDKEAKVNENNVQFMLSERAVFLVFDEKADRMRIMSPIAPAGLANEEILTRMLQANHDAVLDARYSLANDVVWSVFIHPMGSLTQDDFLSGVAQTVTAAKTFGSSYTSGAIVFGGGDSNTIHKDLLKELEDAAQSRTKI